MVRTLDSRRVTVMVASSSVFCSSGVEAAQRVHHGRKDAHGVRGAREVLVEGLHVLVNERVVVQENGEARELAAVRQDAVDEQVCRLWKTGLFR